MGRGRVRKVVRDNDFIWVENDLADESIDNDFSDLDDEEVVETKDSVKTGDFTITSLANENSLPN